MKTILSGTAEKEALHYIKEAAKVAVQGIGSGHICQRAFCGTVIVKNGEIIGQGYNAPPHEDERQRRCHRKAEIKDGFKSDRTCCIHAEQNAVMDALMKQGEPLTGSTLYFTRVDAEGNILKSGQPYCTICSKMSLDAGVSAWVLWHEDGVTCYPANEYNDISFASEGK